MLSSAINCINHPATPATSYYTADTLRNVILSCHPIQDAAKFSPLEIVAERQMRLLVGVRTNQKDLMSCKGKGHVVL